MMDKQMAIEEFEKALESLRDMAYNMMEDSYEKPMEEEPSAEAPPEEASEMAEDMMEGVGPSEDDGLMDDVKDFMRGGKPQGKSEGVAMVISETKGAKKKGRGRRKK